MLISSRGKLIFDPRQLFPTLSALLAHEILAPNDSWMTLKISIILLRDENVDLPKMRCHPEGLSQDTGQDVPGAASVTRMLDMAWG